MSTVYCIITFVYSEDNKRLLPCTAAGVLSFTHTMFVASASLLVCYLWSLMMTSFADILTHSFKIVPDLGCSVWLTKCSRICRCEGFRVFFLFCSAFDFNFLQHALPLEQLLVVLHRKVLCEGKTRRQGSIHTPHNQTHIVFKGELFWDVVGIIYLEPEEG